MRALGALVLALTMLLKAEAAGLADQRINQGVKQAMASLADNRPVVLAKMGYVTYASGAALDPSIMSFTFPASSLSIGDQIHIRVSGVLTNGSAGPYTFGYQARLTGGSTILDIGGPSTFPNGAPGSDAAWMETIDIAVSIPNASGVYIPSTGVNPNAQSSQLRMNVPNTSIAFTGTSTILMGTGSFFGPNFGGILRTTAVDGSSVFSVKFQQIFDASQPIRLDIRPSTGNAPAGGASYLTIETGSVIGM